MNSPSAVAERRAAIEQSRRVRGLRATLSAVSIGQLLFAAFAFGHAQGPVPPRPLEMLLGAGLALGLALAWAGLTQHRHREAGASYQAVLLEGRRRRRWAIHDDYLSIEEEVIPLEVVEWAKQEAGQLVLRYRDPEVGPVLRTFDGPGPVVSALERRLARRP